MITDGFFGRRRDQGYESRIPPGQSRTDSYPVLSFGPTPRMDLTKWRLVVRHEREELGALNWADFNALKQTEFTRDIHCVTRWTKLDMKWKGVLFDDILSALGIEPATGHVTFHGADGYTTNLPLADLRGDKAMAATQYDGQAVTADHGGPIRMVVPHLYFWKSSKWLTGITFTNVDRPGVWERGGYHNYGDPWTEQRFSDD